MKIKFELLTNFSKIEITQNKKILLTISFGWIIFIGYLTWLNGINDMALVKTFKWDEWFCFGLVPATTPYAFYFIWKKKDNTDNNLEEK